MRTEHRARWLEEKLANGTLICNHTQLVLDDLRLEDVLTVACPIDGCRIDVVHQKHVGLWFAVIRGMYKKREAIWITAYAETVKEAVSNAITNFVASRIQGVKDE